MSLCRSHSIIIIFPYDHNNCGLRSVVLIYLHFHSRCSRFIFYIINKFLLLITVRFSLSFSLSIYLSIYLDYRLQSFRKSSFLFSKICACNMARWFRFYYPFELYSGPEATPSRLYGIIFICYYIILFVFFFTRTKQNN